MSFQQLRGAAVLIQAQQRMLVARKRLLRTLRAAVLIQRHMRGRSVRLHMAKQRAAAICIQARSFCISRPRSDAGCLECLHAVIAKVFQEDLQLFFMGAYYNGAQN